MTTERLSGVERLVTISGRRVRVRVRGQGHPVLLVNGLGANVAMWTPLLEQLDGFQVITFDAPGAGMSQTPRLPYTIARVAKVARGILDELGIERADVLGYSLGGAVAQQLALRDPQRIRRLVLVSTSCGAGAFPGSLTALLAVSTPARHYSKPAYRLVMRMVNLAPAERESGFAQSHAVHMHEEAPPPVLGYMLQMAAFSAFNSLPWLHRISHPTLVLSGGEDRIMPMVNSAVLAAHLPHARFRVFERWGHYLLQDGASGAGATVADFLSAQDHRRSRAWKDALTVTPQDLADFVRAAPRSAHPSQLTGGLVRRLHRLQHGRG